MDDQELRALLAINGYRVIESGEPALRRLCRWQLNCDRVGLPPDDPGQGSFFAYPWVGGVCLTVDVKRHGSVATVILSAKDEIGLRLDLSSIQDDIRLFASRSSDKSPSLMIGDVINRALVWSVVTDVQPTWRVIGG